jgi:hypothetical protein
MQAVRPYEVSAAYRGCLPTLSYSNRRSVWLKLETGAGCVRGPAKGHLSASHIDLMHRV